ncbi:MAG: c-type cytochrome [Flavobacteriales bacterium]|nr:c-type cytochrome [Flavobacteriales bacterium]
MTRSVWFLLVLLAISASSCKEEVDECEANTHPYQLQFPDYFPILEVPSDNPLTEEGVQLGRRLYYDPLLSTGGPREGRSCSSCHFQSNSFSVPSTASGSSVLPHVNLAWSRNFLWNGKLEGILEDVMLFEVNDFFEVDFNLLKEDAVYPELFRKAFGSCEITDELVAKALAQWFRRLKSSNSKFDSYLKGEEQLTDSELNGMTTFFTEKGDCFHCHGIPLMTNNEFHNIGLDSIYDPTVKDRSYISGSPYDRLKFKTPTLRNVELTSPYMHDGRFVTLEEVVEHYNSQVKRSMTIDPIMTKPGKEYGLQLTEEEKQNLVAFLKTLTDWEFVNDTSLSSPF